MPDAASSLYWNFLKSPKQVNSDKNEGSLPKTGTWRRAQRVPYFTNWPDRKIRAAPCGSYFIRMKLQPDSPTKRLVRAMCGTSGSAWREVRIRARLQACRKWPNMEGAFRRCGRESHSLRGHEIRRNPPIAHRNPLCRKRAGISEQRSPNVVMNVYFNVEFFIRVLEPFANVRNTRKGHRKLEANEPLIKTLLSGTKT
jgi:hypothetical protein